jgi:hypothetical protein
MHIRDTKMLVCDTDDAVSGVLGLRQALVTELSTIEQLIETVRSTPDAGPEPTAEVSLEVYCLIRTNLLSALAGVTEILGWVRLFAEKDPEGNELESVKSLPYLSLRPTS